MQLAGMDTGTYTKEASCILSNLKIYEIILPNTIYIDIALINLLKSCMEYRCIYMYSTLIKLLGSFPSESDELGKKDLQYCTVL